MANDKSAAAAAWVRPSVLMAADPALRKLVVGMQISPRALGWPQHPVFGQIPDFEVTQVLADGRLGNAKFQCTVEECTNEVAVAPGDLFQKRRCPSCQEKLGGTGRNKRLSPDVKAQRAKEREDKRGLDKIIKAQKQLVETLKANGASAAELAKAEKRRVETLQKAAKEMNVKISDKALAPLA